MGMLRWLVFDNFIFILWDLSSAGRASALQAEGHRFEPYRSHLILIIKFDELKHIIIRVKAQTVYSLLHYSFKLYADVAQWQSS